MIIVTGTQRTGTSMMMDILKKSGMQPLTVKKASTDEFYDNLQPEYHEHPITFLGMNEKTSTLVENSLSNEKVCIKIFDDALLQTDPKYFKHFDKIVVMVRNWKSQNESFKNVTTQSILTMIDNIPDLKNRLRVVSERDNFISDFREPDGTVYAMSYLKIINFIKKNYLDDKCIFINFEDILSNPSIICKKLEKIGLKPELDLVVDPKISKYTNMDSEGKEFKKGFFKFLDRLYSSLKAGKLDREVYIEGLKWFDIIKDNSSGKLDLISQKYNINFNK